MLNEEDKLSRRRIQVGGHTMSLVDTGQGPGVVFLHGSVAHSYSWRNIIPFVAHGHRCLAPDWIGMGDSEIITPSGPGTYSFEDQVEHLEVLLELMEPDRPVAIVAHELGAAVAAVYARRNPERVAGLALVEGVLRVSNDATFDEDVADLLRRVRGEGGEELVLRENRLIEEYLPRLTSRELTETEMESYRRPYLKPGESRRALLSMIRRLPIQSAPGPIDAVVEENRLWCAQEPAFKLVVGGTPGFLVPPPVLATAAKWAATRVGSVPGTHFLMEDSPARLTTVLLNWLDEIGHSD